MKKESDNRQTRDTIFQRSRRETEKNVRLSCNWRNKKKSNWVNREMMNDICRVLFFDQGMTGILTDAGRPELEFWITENRESRRRRRNTPRKQVRGTAEGELLESVASFGLIMQSGATRVWFFAVYLSIRVRFVEIFGVSDWLRNGVDLTVCILLRGKRLIVFFYLF